MDFLRKNNNWEKHFKRSSLQTTVLFHKFSFLGGGEGRVSFQFAFEEELKLKDRAAPFSAIKEQRPGEVPEPRGF